LVEAVEGGLTIPIVYNTSAYDAEESLELLDGIVDIYMPDFKLWSEERSKRWLKAGDYPEVARRAIRAMQRQVGPLQLDSQGVARRGLLIRHLVMPGCFDESREILSWIASELGQDTYVNLMDQYRPAGRVGGQRYAELDLGLRPGEFAQVRSFARQVGLRRLDARRSF
jgi:putative pyruvate formate lyase activating enzyme